MIEPGKHKMSEAMTGQTPVPSDDQNQQAGAPRAPHEVVAEQTREQADAQHAVNHEADRDSRLTRIGRGQQTHG